MNKSTMTTNLYIRLVIEPVVLLLFMCSIEGIDFQQDNAHSNTTIVTQIPRSFSCIL